ncbi:MAG: flagella basal body P-ring formation protein FlgA [Spirochaetales bacterium]|nr:flagella basal body P-ring formation protein FlgA [Spirochaetales bacterium]
MNPILCKFILFLCVLLPLCAEPLYLRDRYVGDPRLPEQVFINTVSREVADSLRSGNILPRVPAIIPPSAFLPYLPKDSPVIGNTLLFIPAGTVPQDLVEQVFALLADMATGGNGKNVVVEVPNWRQMIGKQQSTLEPVSRGSVSVIRGGDYVKVTMKKGPITIRFQGRAQRSGAVGDIIPVLATSTRKQLVCTVVEKGEVFLVQ